MENNPDFCPFCDGVVIADPASVPAKDAPCPHCGEVLWFVRKTVGDVVILTFLPGLMAGSESIERVDEVVSAIGDARRVVLNLSHLHFIASMFLGMLVVLHKRVASANGTLKLCGVQPDASVVFKITKFDTIFAIYDSERPAVESF
jgi:anti-anti-sigma factor